MSCWEIEFFLCHVHVSVNFVGYDDDRNVRTIMPQFLVPRLQVFVSYLSGNIECQDASIRLKVIRTMEFVELFLTSCVPKVNGVVLMSLIYVIVAKKCERIRGSCPRRVVFQQKAFKNFRLTNCGISQHNNLQISIFLIMTCIVSTGCPH